MNSVHKYFFKVGLLVGCLLIGNNYTLAKKPDLETKVVQVDVNDPNELKKPVSYKTIDERIIRDFLNDYLKRITPQSDNFQKLRKKHGEKGVLDRYCSAHRLCLDLAFRHQDIDVPDYNIPKEEYLELGKQLSKKQYETSKGVSKIDYLDEKVVKAFENWGKLKTENFQRLLKVSKKVKLEEELETKKEKEDYIKKVHNLAYTKDQYAEYVKQQNKANGELYSAMKKTLNPIEAWVGGREIERIADMTRKVYEEPLKKYFEDGKRK